jgi:heme exporter protein C
MLQNRLLRFVYKLLAVLLLSYALVYGLLTTVPRLQQLGQTSRNLFYHLPMWFTMYLVMGVSVYYAIRHLRRFRPQDDLKSREAAKVGVAFGLCGLFTGIVWSRVTWGALYPDSDPYAWWSWDPKQTMSLAALLIYGAYFILRNSLDDPHKRARIAAVYNVFACASLIPLTLIIPRIIGGQHPGAGGGGPLFDSKDMSDDYRWILYPAILGFMLLALWIFELRARTAVLAHHLETLEDDADAVDNPAQ